MFVSEISLVSMAKFATYQPDVQGDTKKQELLKNPQKLKKSKKKNLLTEIEPLQLAF